MGYKFALLEDVHRRLNDTICKYKGEPYYVRAAAPIVRLYNVEDMDSPVVHDNVDYSGDDFDFTFPEIGYVNYNDHAYYIERVSGRDQRMGLPPDMIKYVHGMVPKALFRSKGMKLMLLNQYPSIVEAVNSPSNSIAISRDYAIERQEDRVSFDIMYHDKVIGSISKGTDVKYNPYVKNISFFMRSFKRFEDQLRGSHET